MQISEKHIPLLLISGFLGSLLMLTGDMLLYFHQVNGANYDSVKTMSSMPVGRIVSGGLIAPFASFFSIIGGYAFFLIFKRAHSFLAATLFIVFGFMFICAGAYHAVFASYGFVGRLNDPQLSQQLSLLKSYLHSIYGVIFICGTIWTIIIFYLVIFRKTIFPIWLLLFTPTLLILLSGYIKDITPYPLGAVIYGGWINLSFGLFFFVCFLHFKSKKEKTGF